MSGLLTLLSLSFVMAVASFLAGILPLSISLSRSQLRLLSTVGMGVLVGTSMIVIIPEGVETLYTSNKDTHDHTKRLALSQLDQVRWMPASSSIQSIHPSSRDLSRRDIPGTEVFDVPGPVVPDSFTFETPPKTPTNPGKVGILGGEAGHDGEKENGTVQENEVHHAWIGVALISGFVLMFLIDKVPQLTSTPQPVVKTRNIALNQIGRRFNLTSSQDHEEEETEGFIDSNTSSNTPKRGFATTIGLVIHAAADGIALGASSSASHTSLSLVIFFAIMIHKAPAAFGLTSILLRQGLSKRMARAHLVLFSLAAPTGAILTWMVARILGSGAAHNASTTNWWTGVLLLFSAGTFLYVAMHSMQEVLGGHGEKRELNGHINGSLERRDSMDWSDDPKPSFKDLGAALFGMILPLFLQVRHVH